MVAIRRYRALNRMSSIVLPLCASVMEAKTYWPYGAISRESKHLLVAYLLRTESVHVDCTVHAPVREASGFLLLEIYPTRRRYRAVENVRNLLLQIPRHCVPYDDLAVCACA